MKPKGLFAFLPILILSTLCLALGSCSTSTGPIFLRDAVQFDESHAFTRTLRKFERSGMGSALVFKYWRGYIGCLTLLHALPAYIGKPNPD